MPPCARSGMAASGDPDLEREAATGLVTLAAHQAANGQIPKFVDAKRAEADFWYLGCIDATLWWLVGVALVDRLRRGGTLARALRSRDRAGDRAGSPARSTSASSCCSRTRRATGPTSCRAPASCSTPTRSGICVKRLYALPHAAETHAQLQPALPSVLGRARRVPARASARALRAQAGAQSRPVSELRQFLVLRRRGRRVRQRARRAVRARRRPGARRTLRALEHARCNEPYPVRVGLRSDPGSGARCGGRTCRATARTSHGSTTTAASGRSSAAFWVAALAQPGCGSSARAELVKVARANALEHWQFNEWLHGRTLVPSGMPGQSWNAAAFLIACDAIEGNRLFGSSAAAPASRHRRPPPRIS